MPPRDAMALAATDPERYARCPNIRRILSGGQPGNPIVRAASVAMQAVMNQPANEQRAECEIVKRTLGGNVQVIRFIILARAKYPEMK